MVLPTKRAEFDVFGVCLCQVATVIFPCGTFLIRLLPSPNNCGLLPNPKKIYDLNLCTSISSIESFCTPERLFVRDRKHVGSRQYPPRVPSTQRPEKNNTNNIYIIVIVFCFVKESKNERRKEIKCFVNIRSVLHIMYLIVFVCHGFALLRARAFSNPLQNYLRARRWRGTLS